MNRVDPGALLGLEIRWSAGATALLVDARYDLGFREVDPAIGGKNTARSLLLGLARPLP